MFLKWIKSDGKNEFQFLLKLRNTSQNMKIISKTLIKIKKYFYFMNYFNSK